MIGTVFRSDDVPPEDRFDYWRELVGRTHAPSDMSSEYTTDFWAEQRLLELGPVTVWRPRSGRPGSTATPGWCDGPTRSCTTSPWCSAAAWESTTPAGPTPTARRTCT